MPLEIANAEYSVSVIDTVTNRDMQQGFATSLLNGNFLVTWCDSGLADLSGSCIRARIYSADGRPLTDQFTANSTVTNDQSNPAAATLADGRIVLIWQSEDSGFLGSRQIRCRIFNEDGSPTGDDFLVDSALELQKSNPVVSSRPDGGFSISWQTNSTSADIATRNFDSDGETMGPVYRVNDATADYQFGVSQAVLQSDIIFYTYYSGAVGPDGSGRLILGRFATAEGIAIGGEFSVASGPARDRDNPRSH